MDVPIIGFSGPSDSRSLHLETRRRNFIHNETRLAKPLPLMKAGHEILRSEMPNARLRSLAAEYNCMGMVFGSRRTWIDPDRFLMIVTDDGYRLLPKGAAVVQGDVAVYRNRVSLEVEHVGIVVGIKVEAGGSGLEVLSKFGADGEYFHAAEEVPAMFSTSGGCALEIWTDRSCQ